MGRCKDIVVKVIPSRVANSFVRSHHYSAKVAPNSKIHFGAFLDGYLHGVLSFGPSMKKSALIALVKHTSWNGFIELNRMAFDDVLPKNSESRALSVCFRLLKKKAPHIKWIITFADGCQCGDGTIYRASGFLLSRIKLNTTLRINPETKIVTQQMQAFHMKKANEFHHWKPLPGYQLRYIYFLDKSKIKDLTVPIIPFSEIDRRGVGMYKGKAKRAGSIGDDATGYQPDEGGSTPTSALQNIEAVA